MVNLFLVLILICCPSMAVAGPVHVLVVPSSETNAQGKEFTITVKLTDDIQDMAAWNCSLEFDPALLYVNNIADGEVTIPGGMFSSYVNPDKHINVLEFNMQGSSFSGNGVLAAVSGFGINSGTEAIKSVDCTFVQPDASVIDVEVETVPVEITGPKIYFGDNDGDDDIDGRDLVVFSQQVSSPVCSEDGCDAGDFDNNKEVNWQDIAIFASSFGTDNIE